MEEICSGASCGKRVIVQDVQEVIKKTRED
jgi:hypothetical protein